jgi:lipoprotein-releasing system permease protein
VSAVRVEGFVAYRYLRARTRVSFIHIISLLATLGIAFGVAALVVVMSVFNGFNTLVVSILQGFDPHVKVERVAHAAAAADQDSVRALVERLAGTTGVAPFVEHKALALGRETQQFVRVTGVDSARVGSVSGLPASIVLGDAAFRLHNGVVLGVTLADRMRALLGDTITLVSPVGMEGMLTQIATPAALRCPVEGIFESKNKLYDNGVAFLSLSDAGRLFRTGGRVSGFDVRLRDIGASEAARDALRAAVGPGWRVSTWRDLHKDLYAVMTIERWSAFVLLSTIIAVAAFNILASLTMLVLEKRRDIGVLRAMGMPAAGVRRTFLRTGMAIGAIGVAAGTAVGVALAWAQKTYGFLRLDSAFIIPALPVELRAGDIVLIALCTFGLCLLAAWVPAARARKVEIVEAIRWE